MTNINGRWYGRALLEREVASFAEQVRSPRIAARGAAPGLESRPHSCRRADFLLSRLCCVPSAQLLLRGSALGELDHPAPDSPSFRRINRDNASHRLLDLWWERNDLHATVQVLPTRAGELIRDVYLAGAKCACRCACWRARPV